jgi:hypothetical protein
MLSGHLLGVRNAPEFEILLPHETPIEKPVRPLEECVAEPAAARLDCQNTGFMEVLHLVESMGWDFCAC